MLSYTPDMPRPARSWRSGGGARAALIVLAAGLGVAALCLVVFGSSRRQLQLGMLLGLWAALTAVYLQVLARDGGDGVPPQELAEARAQAAELHEAQLAVVALQQEQLEAARQAYFSQEIELRRFSEQQLSRETGARQESEQRLQLALGREVERVLLDQLASLREEVAALRAEVVDKLGGQLRLERIETTRVIGSDLEALQHEIRRLAAAGPDGIAAPVAAPEVPSRSGPDSRDIVDAELVEFPPPPADLAAIPDFRPAADADAGAGAGADADAGAGSGERRGGRRRAPEPEPPADDPRYPADDSRYPGDDPRYPGDDPRYQGRRRADGSPADRFASLDS